jgi:hypothetical protein
MRNTFDLMIEGIMEGDVIDKKKIVFADQTMAQSLDKEIQEIFQALIDTDTRIWASDESYISHVTKEQNDFDRVKTRLGIEIRGSDKFVEAALRLRALRGIGN